MSSTGKRNFTTDCTLVADMRPTYRNISYMRPIQTIRAPSEVAVAVAVAAAVATRAHHSSYSALLDRKDLRLPSQTIYTALYLYSDSMFVDVFAGSSTKVLLPKRPLFPHLD